MRGSSASLGGRGGKFGQEKSIRSVRGGRLDGIHVHSLPVAPAGERDGGSVRDRLLSARGRKVGVIGGGDDNLAAAALVEEIDNGVLAADMEAHTLQGLHVGGFSRGEKARGKAGSSEDGFDRGHGLVPF